MSLLWLGKYIFHNSSKNKDPISISVIQENPMVSLKEYFVITSTLKNILKLLDFFYPSRFNLPSHPLMSKTLLLLMWRDILRSFLYQKIRPNWAIYQVLKCSNVRLWQAEESKFIFNFVLVFAIYHSNTRAWGIFWQAKFWKLENISLSNLTFAN